MIFSGTVFMHHFDHTNRKKLSPAHSFRDSNNFRCIPSREQRTVSAHHDSCHSLKNRESMHQAVTTALGSCRLSWTGGNAAPAAAACSIPTMVQGIVCLRLNFRASNTFSQCQRDSAPGTVSHSSAQHLLDETNCPLLARHDKRPMLPWRTRREFEELNVPMVSLCHCQKTVRSLHRLSPPRSLHVAFT